MQRADVGVSAVPELSENGFGRCLYESISSSLGRIPALKVRICWYLTEAGVSL